MLQWLFHGDCGTTCNEIVRWWEIRRLPFNVLVGLVGVATWLLVMTAGSAAVRPGEDFEEPIVMIFGPPIYAVLANICYTFGWIVDMTYYRGAPRRRLFKAGLIFSIVLTALPGLWAVAAWLITIHTGRKI
jgi:uncharacterized BrkB/YihY/UPF0761 family membrane protein